MENIKSHVLVFCWTYIVLVLSIHILIQLTLFWHNLTKQILIIKACHVLFALLLPEIVLFVCTTVRQSKYHSQFCFTIVNNTFHNLLFAFHYNFRCSVPCKISIALKFVSTNTWRAIASLCEEQEHLSFKQILLESVWKSQVRF